MSKRLFNPLFKKWFFLFTILSLLNFAITYYIPTLQQAWAANPISNTNPTLRNATITNNTDFLVYDNTTIGFKLQYPSNWEVFEPLNSTTIRFVSPFENSSDRYRETVDISLFGLKNSSLDKFIANTTKVLQGSLNDFQIILSNTTTLAGYPSRTLVYMYSDPLIGITKSMLISTLQDNVYLYNIKYFAKPSDYDNSLPIIQKMIDSFQIH